MRGWGGEIRGGGGRVEGEERVNNNWDGGRQGVGGVGVERE